MRGRGGGVPQLELSGDPLQGQAQSPLGRPPAGPREVPLLGLFPLQCHSSGAGVFRDLGPWISGAGRVAGPQGLLPTEVVFGWKV